jgi:hypothetical protein
VNGKNYTMKSIITVNVSSEFVRIKESKNNK